MTAPPPPPPAHTELAIGNIVRRVLHMIREEQQHLEDDAEPAPSTSAAAQQQAAAHSSGSLLSQALGRPGRFISRVISLSNLLDQVGALHQPGCALAGLVGTQAAARRLRQAGWDLPVAWELALLGGLPLVDAALVQPG
jgi:hypothetical protein